MRCRRLRSRRSVRARVSGHRARVRVLAVLVDGRILDATRETRQGARPRPRPRARPRDRVARTPPSGRGRRRTPRSGDGAVDEERADRLRHPRREDPRPVLLGEHARATRVDEEDGVPGREEAHRCGRLGIRQRRAREVEELAAGLVAEAPELQALEDRREVAGPQVPAHRAMSLRDAGPERAEIAADEVVAARRARRRLRARPSARPSGRGARAASPTCPTAARERARATARPFPSCRRPPRRAPRVGAARPP